MGVQREHGALRKTVKKWKKKNKLTVRGGEKHVNRIQEAKKERSKILMCL